MEERNCRSALSAAARSSPVTLKDSSAGYSAATASKVSYTSSESTRY